MKYKLIRAQFLLPLSDTLGRNTRIEDGYLLTDADRIAEVGQYTPEIGKRILRQYQGQLQILGGVQKESLSEGDIPKLYGVLMPGFVKAHGHDHESPIIGIAKDVPLTTWLDRAVNMFTGFLKEKLKELTERFNRSPYLVTYLKARLDDIYYGITSSLVHHCNFNKYFVEELVKANSMAGTKMIIAVGGQDRHYDKRILDTPQEAVERMNRYWDAFSKTPRTWVIPGPDQEFSNGPDMLKTLKAWATEKGTLLHIHSSEEPGTTQWFTKEYGMHPVEYLHSINVLDQDTLLAHQVNNTENVLKILQKTRVKIVHNPLANTILGSGMPPLVEFQKMGIPFVISTDGSGSADNQNILGAARLASQYQKAFNKDASILKSQQLLELITVEPARFLKLNTGALEPGKDADAILLDLNRPNMTPTRIDNVAENLIWASNGSEVRYVIANGKVLMDNYRILTIDADEIMRDVRILSQMMVDHARIAKEITGTGAHKA